MDRAKTHVHVTGMHYQMFVIYMIFNISLTPVWYLCACKNAWAAASKACENKKWFEGQLNGYLSSNSSDRQINTTEAKAVVWDQLSLDGVLVSFHWRGGVGSDLWAVCPCMEWPGLQKSLSSCCLPFDTQTEQKRGSWLPVPLQPQGWCEGSVTFLRASVCCWVTTHNHVLFVTLFCRRGQAPCSSHLHRETAHPQSKCTGPWASGRLGY